MDIKNRGFATTISSTVGLISLALSVVSASKAIVDIFRIPFGSFAARMYSVFESTVHPIVRFPAEFVFGLDLSKIEINVVSLYLLFGLAGRAFILKLLDDADRSEGQAIPRGAESSNLGRAIIRYCAGFMYFFLWPFIFVLAAETPYVYLVNSGTDHSRFQNSDAAPGVDGKPLLKKESDWVLQYDIRKVFLVQLLTVIAGVLGLLFLGYSF